MTPFTRRILLAALLGLALHSAPVLAQCTAPGPGGGSSAAPSVTEPTPAATAPAAWGSGGRPLVTWRDLAASVRLIVAGRVWAPVFRSRETRALPPRVRG